MNPLQTYSRDVVAEVLAATDIVEVIGVSLDLKPAGSNRFKGLCPFHNEKTPSFSVNRDRQMYHCFGCGKSGDAITFLREYEGLSYPDALRKLADRAGVRLPAPSANDHREDYQRQKLIELGAFAQKFFCRMFNDRDRGAKARAYVDGRGLRAETIKRFALGYAPASFGEFRDAALKAGFREDILALSGLVRRSEKGVVYDFFRDRLMFPIRDVPGNTVAFGGRDLSGEAPGKYINTPEGPVYKKSRILFGLHEAREALRREKRALLVEGYFDLIRCFDAGIENVVASCGTALTPEQGALIRRYVSEVVVVYDGDTAGIRAALRGVAILNSCGLSVRALALPHGQDPDDFIKSESSDTFRKLVDNAPDFVSFYIDMNRERLGTIEGRTEVAKELFAILRDVKDELRRDEYLKQVAKGLRVDEWTLRREYRKHSQDRHVPATEVREKVLTSVAPAISVDDRLFLALILGHEALLEKAKQELKGLNLTPGPLTEVLSALFQDGESKTLLCLETDEAKKLYAEAANDNVPWDEKAELLLNKRIVRFKKEALGAELTRIGEAIRQAERGKDSKAAFQLIMQKAQLDKAFQNLGAT